jgi:hypothetical protein
MKKNIQTDVKHDSIYPLFFIGSLSLIILTIFTSGCFNNPDHSIQVVTSSEYKPLVAPTSGNISNQETEDKKYITDEKSLYKNPISIKAKQSQKNIRPSLTNKTLLLGNSRIENWPLGLPVCKQCNLELTRDFHPDGPDTLVVLSHSESNYQWGVFQSGQKQAHLLGTKLYVDRNGKLNINKIDSGVATLLQVGQTYRLKNCRISPLWIENIKPLSSAYSDDQPKHKIQIFFECQ